MTVARLREEMSADEYLRWCVFYQKKAQAMDIEAKKLRGR